MESNDSDSSDARNMGFNFAGKAVYTAIWVAAVSLFMELLCFSAQQWLTAGGLGTVLLTVTGREHVGWWSPTIIRGDDREVVHIPNHKFTVSVVRNLSQKTHWRIKTHLAISHLDVHKVNNIVADMLKVLAKNPQVEQQRLHRRVFLENVDPENQALMILVSCFVKTSHFEEYLCVKEAVLLDLLRVILAIIGPAWPLPSEQCRKFTVMLTWRMYHLLTLFILEQLLTVHFFSLILTRSMMMRKLRLQLVWYKTKKKMQRLK